MKIEETKIIQLFKSNNFLLSNQTKKLIEFRSSRNNQYIYFRKDIGLPNYIRVVIHPELEYVKLLDISGVEINKNEFQHGSNMKKFPKRINKGECLINYGRAINIDSESSCHKFCEVFH